MPAPVEVRAIDFISAFRSGLTDSSLMEKFGLNGPMLQNVYKQMQSLGILSSQELSNRISDHNSVVVDLDRERLPILEQKKVVINAYEAVELIKSGLDDRELMDRYRLSARGLQSLITKLVKAGLIEQSETDSRHTKSESVLLADSQVKDNPLLLDIRECLESGKDGREIREKYGLNLEQFDQLLAEVNSAIGMEKKSVTSTGRFLTIKKKNSGEIIYAARCASLSELLENAVTLGIDLSDADLAGRNLSRARLSGATMRGVDLRRANLIGTDLSGANLADALLTSANMFGVILQKTNLSNADLADANLSCAFARWAFLPGANLSEANLSYADFSGSHMARACIFETIREGTNLNGAYFDEADLIESRQKGLLTE